MRFAAREFGADWVINTDADEFWLPRRGALKATFDAVPQPFGAVHAVSRHFVPRPDDGASFDERMTLRFTADAALNDLVGGQLSFMIENVPGTMPFVKGGKLRGLAITSAQRSPLDPALPTMAEAGVPGYEVVGWNGIVALAATPPEIVARLQAEVAKVLGLPQVRERLAAMGAEPVGGTPEQFGAFLRAERTRWGTIIREKGIRSE